MRSAALFARPLVMDIAPDDREPPAWEREADRKIAIAVADESDRQAIHRLRHEVYARELGQHAANETGELHDALDEWNHYLVARRGEKIAGFVSITPPPTEDNRARHRYSIDKYVPRERLPLTFDGHLFEVRILTVMPPHRGGALALLLMHAALRWVEDHGGREIVAIGRREVVPLYRSVGLRALDIEFASGAVRYQAMSARVSELHAEVSRWRPRLRRVLARVSWELPMPALPAITCFHGGLFFHAIGERFDDLSRRKRIINADVLDAWFDPAPGVLQALREHLPWLLRTSPPTGCGGMIDAVAEARGVDRRNILPGAGSSDLIFLALPRWLNAGSRALILDPTYGEYAHVLQRVIGCRVDRLTVHRDNNYDVDPRELRLKLRERYDLVVIVNPNSPTGRFMDSALLWNVLADAPRRTRFWIDETYLEYVGAEHSLERQAMASSNVVVCKSMSKVYALSGLRAAYLCGPEAMLDELRPFSPPWAVSLPAQVASVKALEDRSYYQARYRETHELRTGLATSLRDRCGLHVVDGVANFLLAHVATGQPSAAEVASRCAQHGLFIRDASTMGSCLGPRAFRLAVKDAATNREMAGILENAVK